MSERITNELKNIKGTKHNLHEHLKELIARLLLHRGGIDDIESYSFAAKFLLRDEQCVFKIREAYSNLKDYAYKNSVLLAKLNAGTYEEPQYPTSIGYVPDMLEEARFFERFGIGFGEDESYRIFKSLCVHLIFIQKFSLAKKARETRFWGKIMGSEKDYYIIEAAADGGEEATYLSPDTYPKGTGANKTSYWATNALSGDWSYLPIITPKQIQVSRKIKYLFTGDLNKSILTNPFFPGKEAHLLKCQIVRISMSCTLVPKGMFVVNADNPNEVDVPEEWVYPYVQQLGAMENWVYSSSCLLKNGRTTLLKPEGLEPEYEYKAMKALALKDPTEPRLKSIAIDSQHWSIKCYGLYYFFRVLGKSGKTVCKGAVCVKSLVWPGWYTVASGGKHASVYVGYAHKYKLNYYPVSPEATLAECTDRTEFVVPE